MKITVLIENTAESTLACEHGLSFLIEYHKEKILLDAGTSSAFCKNARDLGIDLKEVTMGVLSHGHYDHSGGFAEFFRMNDVCQVYLQETAFGSYWSGSGGLHRIGIPEEVKAFRERFVPVSGNQKIREGVYLAAHHTAGLEVIGEKAKLYKKEGEELLPDDFIHEQSLIFDTEKGLVIFNSCSHGGAECIIREAKEVCPGRPVYAYIGGLHMKGKKEDQEICTFSEAELDHLAEVIREEGIYRVYTGHCTGIPGTEELQKRLGEVVQKMTSGMEMEL